VTIHWKSTAQKNTLFSFRKKGNFFYTQKYKRGVWECKNGNLSFSNFFHIYAMPQYIFCLRCKYICYIVAFFFCWFYTFYCVIKIYISLLAFYLIRKNRNRNATYLLLNVTEKYRCKFFENFELLVSLTTDWRVKL